MAIPTKSEADIGIRDIAGISEIRAVEELQKEVWGFADRDIVPVTQLAPVRDLGGTLIGAFDGRVLAGFVYGFVGCENGAPHLHSEMLAVKPGYRSRGIGYRLKLAQRERALARGFTLITWTFDPLQGRNASFNFTKLGVVADEYKVNYYGESTSSPLHACGTDRLWVKWWLDSRRVRARLDAGPAGAAAPWPPEALRLLAVDPDRSPAPRPGEPEGAALLIEIPGDLTGLTRQCPALAGAWREATREAFSAALGRGYVAAEFGPSPGGEADVWAYLLRLGE